MSILNSHSQITITNFSEQDPEWIIVDDGVMGGLSESSLALHPNGTALYSGDVSLQNNGGFASTRMLIDKDMPSAYSEIVLRVKGDGKKYNFRIRKNKEFDGLAYDFEFSTNEDEWMEIKLPLSDFQGTFRGRKYEDKIGVLSEDIGQIGILIANKQEGAFQIEMDWIKISK